MNERSTVVAASGIFMMMVVGGGVLPLLQSKVADLSGFLSSYWVIFAGLVYLLYYNFLQHNNRLKIFVALLNHFLKNQQLS